MMFRSQSMLDRLRHRKARRSCCVLIFVFGCVLGFHFRLIVSTSESYMEEAGPEMVASSLKGKEYPFHLTHAGLSAVIDGLQEQLLSKWDDFTNESSSRNSTYLALTNFHAMGSNRSATDRSLVLATHLSVDRIKERLPLLLQFWNGPTSVAFYFNTANQITRFVWALKALDTLDQRKLLGGDCILHFVLEPNAPPSYPRNIMRNVAMQYNFRKRHPNKEHDFVLATDANVIPTWNAHGTLIKLLYGKQQQSSEPSLLEHLRSKAALAMPIFNFVPQDGQKQVEIDTLMKLLPKTRSEMIQLYYHNISLHFPYILGHEANNYTYWLEQQDGSRTEVAYPIKPKIGYEPFFVAHRPSLPKYWEAFRGFGLDKQSFVAQMVLEGFHFRVLFDLYMVHLHHPTTIVDDEREANFMEWQTNFKDYLKNQYPNPTRNRKRFFQIPSLQDLT